MIVVVIPAKDEAGSIGALLDAVRSVVDRVVVVDDGSVDGTATVAREWGAIVIENQKNIGVGASTLKGLRHAMSLSPEVVVCMDADGQHEAKWIARAAALIREEGAEAILADRFHRLNGIPETKCLSNNLGWDILSRIMGTAPICRDVSCGFRAYAPTGVAQILKAANTLPAGYAFVQSSTLVLHQSLLRLSVLPVPALYDTAVVGTPIGELVGFLEWVSGFGKHASFARTWMSSIEAQTAFCFEMLGWEGDLLDVVTTHRDGQIVFSVKTKDTHSLEVNP